MILFQTDVDGFFNLQYESLQILYQVVLILSVVFSDAMIKVVCLKIAQPSEKVLIFDPLSRGLPGPQGFISSCHH